MGLAHEPTQEGAQADHGPTEFKHEILTLDIAQFPQSASEKASKPGSGGENGLSTATRADAFGVSAHRSDEARAATAAPTTTVMRCIDDLAVKSSS